MKSRATVVIPFGHRVLVVRALNRTDFSIRLTEVAQAFDTISGIQFSVGIETSPEWCPLGTV